MEKKHSDVAKADRFGTVSLADLLADASADFVKDYGPGPGEELGPEDGVPYDAMPQEIRAFLEGPLHGGRLWPIAPPILKSGARVRLMHCPKHGNYVAVTTRTRMGKRVTELCHKCFVENGGLMQG